MNWKADFKRGKKAGKKHPTSYSADLKYIEEEEAQKKDKKIDELQRRLAEVDHHIQEIEDKLRMIKQFLEDT